jgi:hypothetical protein
VKLDPTLISRPPSSDVVIADGNASTHTLEQFREEFLKNLDDAAVSWFSGIPNSLFAHRVEQVAHESWESLARKWEAAGWGTDPRFSDREFAKILLRVLSDFYPGDSVQKVLEEATEFVKQARINQSGRILSWDEVQQFAAGQPDKWGRKYLALRFVTLMQTADGFSWELLEPLGHK